MGLTEGFFFKRRSSEKLRGKEGAIEGRDAKRRCAVFTASAISHEVWRSRGGGHPSEDGA